VRWGGLLGLALLLVSLTPSGALEGVEGVGGTYRYGHIRWTSEGNMVTFTLEVAYKRNITDTSYWKGTAPDLLSQVGDEITLFGRQAPQFYFGDGSVQSVIKAQVTAMSVQQDWVMGAAEMTHRYATPNNKGTPWYAQLVGCCRDASLSNNKDSEYVIAASVDLTAGDRSPRANVLPVVSVPLRPSGWPAVKPSVKVPAQVDIGGAVPFSYSMAVPFDVGNAADFSSAAKSYLAVSMKAVYVDALGVSHQGFSDPYSLAECDTTVQGATNNRIHPACLYRALRSDGEIPAITIEGWVRADTDAGGYVLSMGLDERPAAFGGPADMVCAMGMAPGAVQSLEFKSKCKVSPIFIKVSKTAVTVGHERDPRDTVHNAVYQEVFTVCSSTTLSTQDVCTKGLTGQWVHVAVTRFHHRDGGSLADVNNLMVSYRVVLNGEPLEVGKFPGGGAVQRDPVPLAVPASLEFEVGQSNLMVGPMALAVSGIDSGQFAGGTALLFGAYKGAVGQASYFQGKMDEWRFWNGARSLSQIRSAMRRILNPAKESFYGDPANPATVVHAENFLRESVLMASWSFDQVCPLFGATGCPLEQADPVYPREHDPRIPAGGRGMYSAYSAGVLTGDTDNTGKIFYSSQGMAIDAAGTLTITTEVAGTYQAMVLVSYMGGRISVPVDFIIEVIPAACGQDATSCAMLSCGLPADECSFAGNAFIPALSVFGHVQRISAGLAGVSVGGVAADLEEYLFPNMIRTFAGSEFGVTLQGEDKQGGAAGWRDTNVGFTIGAAPAGMRFSTVRGDATSQMDLRWRPCLADVGVTTVCFDAVDRHFDRATGRVARPAASPEKCLKILVQDDPAPFFVLGGDEGTPHETQMLMMGREARFMVVVAEENCVDNVTISVARDAPLPAGARLEAAVFSAGGEGCVTARRRFAWAPTYNQGGWNATVCFVATDSGSVCTGMASHSATHCVRMEVARCVYALQQDHELQSIAGSFGTDWIRLWSLNPGLMHPDYMLYGAGNRTLNVGHLYRANPREMPAAVAARMGMQVEQLRFMNFGLDLSSPLSAGQPLCVIPNSCAGHRESVYDFKYASPGFFSAKTSA